MLIVGHIITTFLFFIWFYLWCAPLGKENMDQALGIIRYNCSCKNFLFLQSRSKITCLFLNHFLSSSDDLRKTPLEKPSVLQNTNSQAVISSYIWPQSIFFIEHPQPPKKQGWQTTETPMIGDFHLLEADRYSNWFDYKDTWGKVHLLRKTTTKGTMHMTPGVAICSTRRGEHL